MAAFFCFSTAGVSESQAAMRSAGDGVEPCLSEVDRAKETAEARIGRLPVEGRYHRLPRRFEDDYELVAGGELGTGYNGAVVLARSRRSGVAYAVKAFNMVDVEASEREEFASEVGIYLSMDHPHVARLMEVYESETEISMVMECCEGGELFDRVKRKKVFTEQEAAQATWQMLLAINYLHGEGVVHRDLKLENFLYEQKNSNWLKLIDFGFSKFFRRSAAMRESLGTINYIAPEVLNGSYFCGSCDMWSLGVIVFTLLGGYMPFPGGSDSEIIRAIRRGQFTMHAARWAHVSEPARDFVRRLLIVRPCDRMTAQQAMRHPWMAAQSGAASTAPGGSMPSDGAAAPAADDVAEAFLSFARATRFQQACMQMMAWTLPLEERRRLRCTFLEMDTSHKGVLRFPQLNQILKETYHMSRVDRATVCRAVAVLDVDNDGEVHYSDFLAVMMALRLKQRDCDAIQEAFRRFDKEGLGYLTEEGLWQVLSEQVSRSELRRIFRLVDIDSDGRIDLDEFIAYLHEACGQIVNPKLLLGESKWQMRRRIKGMFHLTRGAAAAGA